MSRSVKCYVTGEIGTNDTFVKIGCHYYKSRAVYEKYRHEIDTRNAVVSMIAVKFLGYQRGQKFPAYIQKKLNEFSFYSYDVILRTFEKCSDSIIYYMSKKEFRNESGKIAYIFAVLSNNINDVNKELEWDKKAQEKESKTEMNSEQGINMMRPNTKVKNVSAWLDEEDL